MIRNCRICNRDLITIKKITGNRFNTMTNTYSKDGVYFQEGCCWFCNSCWKELLKACKTNKY